ncbi:MAG: alcohol dehydrogenase catalytic domain-containing protein [Bdellovibrio sp.]|nr:alcohol dehydrogenase catalytic domain-containing protein [Bdellovibrio sp.]
MFQQIYIRKFGAPSVLSLEEGKEESTPLASDEVSVEVHYSGINFADIVMRLGFYKDAPPKPFIPGYEFSGVITQIGSDVKQHKVGDRVYGGSVFGAYTSDIRVKSWMAIKLPDNFSLEEGASLPVAFITAYAALFEMARVRSGDKVLIDCASGGLGTLALKMLKAVGAEVTGLTSSNSKKNLIESLGARARTHGEFWQDAEDTRYDFILNSQGGSSIMRHYDRLGPTGRIVCLGLSEGIKGGGRHFLTIAKAAIQMPRFSVIKMFDKNRGVFALNALKLMEDSLYIRKNLEQFDKITQWNLKPIIGKIFPAKDVALAHQFIEEKRGQGKILLAWR